MAKTRRDIMSIWKTLRQEKPKNFHNLFILTKSNRIIRGFYCSEDKNFYRRDGWVKPVKYKRWCYEEDLINQVLMEIKK
jgi:hypothetical protein